MINYEQRFRMAISRENALLSNMSYQMLTKLRSKIEQSERLFSSTMTNAELIAFEDAKKSINKEIDLIESFWVNDDLQDNEVGEEIVRKMRNGEI